MDKMRDNAESVVLGLGDALVFAYKMPMDSEKQHAIRQAVLRAMLVHVPFDGWGAAALSAAAADLGMAEDAVLALFPQGAADAIDGFVGMSDDDMARDFAALTAPPEGVTATIKTLVMLKLAGAEPHRQAVAEALKILSRPHYAGLGMRVLYRTVDRMWRLAGDRSVDWNFYSKRAILAGVYSATLAYWAARPGASHAEIEQFLTHRLREAMFVPKMTAPARKAAGKAVGSGMRMAGRIFGRPPWTRSS